MMRRAFPGDAQRSHSNTRLGNWINSLQVRTLILPSPSHPNGNRHTSLKVNWSDRDQYSSTELILALHLELLSLCAIWQEFPLCVPLFHAACTASPRPLPVFSKESRPRIFWVTWARVKKMDVPQPYQYTPRMLSQSPILHDEKLVNRIKWN